VFINQKSISQQFSTYLSLKDRPTGKVAIPQSIVDGSLRNFIEKLLELNTQASTEDWSRCFLSSLLQAQRMYQRLWLTPNCIQKIIIYSGYLFICQNGLFCYLQPSCWKAAKTVSNRLQQSKSFALHYSVEDCYLIACELSWQPATLLRRFDFTIAVPLKAYARSALQQAVKDRIARELKSKAIKFSGLGRLKNLSPSRLEKLFLEYGLRGETLEQHRLLASVFKQLWETLQNFSSSSGRHRYNLRIYSLSDDQLTQIAEGYNRQTQRLQWDEQGIDGRQVKLMLETCLQAIQSQEIQHSLSLEEITHVPEITISSQLNPLDTAIGEEQQQDFLEVRQAVEKVLDKLDKKAYQGLLLSLGLDINQSDLAALLGVEKQYQVARQFQRYQRIILRELTQFYQSSSQKMSAEAEQEILIVVKDYLGVYSKRFFAEHLESVIAQQLTPSEQKMLVNSIEGVMKPREEPVLAKLIGVFQSNIEKQLNLKLTNIQSASEKLELFVTEWLQHNQAKFQKEDI
jgi:hypothetical protein